MKQQHVIILKDLSFSRFDALDFEKKAMALKMRCNYDLCHEDHDHKPAGFIAEEHCILHLRKNFPESVVEKATGGNEGFDVLLKKDNISRRIQVKSHTAASYCLSSKGISWGYSIFKPKSLEKFDDLVVAFVGDTFSILLPVGPHPGKSAKVWPKTDRFSWSKFLGKDKMQRAIDTSRLLWGKCYDDLSEEVKKEISEVF